MIAHTPAIFHSEARKARTQLKDLRRDGSAVGDKMTSDFVEEEFAAGNGAEALPDRPNEGTDVFSFCHDLHSNMISLSLQESREERESHH